MFFCIQSLRYHPDKQDEDVQLTNYQREELREKFEQISKAYEVIGDHDTRMICTCGRGITQFILLALTGSLFNLQLIVLEARSSRMNGNIGEQNRKVEQNQRTVSILMILT